jgi:GTP-binding protein YchF
MSVNIGIIGLAKSGRTTVFNVLTGLATDGSGQAPRIGVTKVPDPRLSVLADMLHPKRVVLTEVQFIDIGATTGGLGGSRGIGGQLLSELSNVDAIMAVVRAFAGESVPHVEGSLDMERDIAAVGLELCISDLAILERRLDKMKESLKGAKPPEHQHLLREQEILLAIKGDLEKDVPIRQLTLPPDDARLIAGYQFLTAKPLLIVVNIGEEQLSQAATLEEQLNSRYAGPGCSVITICGKLEMELAQLDEGAAAEFRVEYNLKESGRDLLIQRAYQLLGLISFFTVVSDEVKVWPVPAGTDALRAAGKIHSDMERGFIRAEVIGYDDLVGCGSLAEARRRGLLRLEGKNYQVREGDVVTFLFNV